ncbi:MAG: DUF2264 domain-containing protein [Dysgonamonadaceae bacterium]
MNPQKHPADRSCWSELLFRIARPVLQSMSLNLLRKSMPVEYSPQWDGRSRNVAYMEAFGRLFAGLSPWLNLNDDDSREGQLRKQLREWTLASCVHAADPKAPDYLEWQGEPQALVDAAYIATGFIRAPHATWEKLDHVTQQRYVREFVRLRRIKPFYSNWLLFRAVIEAFLLSIDEDYNKEILLFIIKQINEWYVGDGWYSDGPEFALDYYNSFVMHPMLVEILDLCRRKNLETKIGFELALRRMQRYNVLQERMVSPEGTFPLIGRSITYRMGVFQSLALSAWKYGLPESLSYGLVRNMLTQVMKKLFQQERNFTKEGFLHLGFFGYQPDIADYYTNTGSLYMTALSFLPLGLDPQHEFWTAAPEEWTSRKAWAGQPFPKDYRQSIVS